MTFVGKVLVVVNLVLGICMMVFAAAVFHVQTNWKTKADTLQTSWDTQKEQTVQLQNEYDALKDSSESMIREANRRAIDAQAALDQSKLKVAEAAKREQSLEQQMANFEAESVLNSDEATVRRDEALSMRVINKQLNDTQDQLVGKINNLEDDLYTKTRDIKLMSEKQKRLLEETLTLQRIVRAHNIDPSAPIAADQTPPPPELAGLVMNTRKQGNSGVEYIEISLGSDDGLAEGHVLVVTRTDGRGQYLGKIKLVRVTPDRAVGTVTERAKNGTIQKGDNVSTKI